MTDVPAVERTQVMRFEAWQDDYTWRNLGSFLFTTSDGHIRSQVFICPKCGRLWGRVNCLIENQPDLHHSFEAVTRACAEHGDGSFITHIHIDHIKLLPRAVLKHEILETHYYGKARERRPNPQGQPHAPHGTAGHG